MTAQISLDAQRIKLERLLDERITHYRRGVKKGTLALDAAATKHAEIEAIRRTFAWLCDNHDWIRAEAKRRRDAADVRAAFAAEIESLSEHPAAAAVLDAFPGAEITGVQSLETAP